MRRRLLRSLLFSYAFGRLRAGQVLFIRPLSIPKDSASLLVLRLNR
jgi:hypothetical protein